MSYQELFDFLQHVGKDPSRLIFEDELTGIENRRFLLSYLEHKVHWDGEHDFPLALAIIDIDHFKQINDTHGHEAGDQALTWFAKILKSEAGEDGFPIRYGGDEFILFLPGCNPAAAERRAQKLLDTTRRRSFRLRGTGAELSLTLSIGVATAPTDARDSRALLQSADTALYFAKRSGRNRVTMSAEVDPVKVSTKTALHRLDAAGMVGRRSELSAFSDYLGQLGNGQSRFVVVEAEPGMGKTTFLDTIQRNLARSEDHVLVRTAGDPAEKFRPYYLTTRILAALLNKRKDRGESLFRSLAPRELSYLRHVLPQLPHADSEPEEDEKARREGIFSALARFIPRVLDHRPLILLVDDLSAADEATLLLFRLLVRWEDLPVLLCSTAAQIPSVEEENAVPLGHFYGSYRDELEIETIHLRPLARKEIIEFLRGAFPGLNLSTPFAKDLERLTRGNPLFLTEIARKLVANEKIKMVGRQWVLKELSADYLPRSLEEIVLEKISTLNELDREFLARASTLGEDVPVSLLAGSSQGQESSILEFVDRAAALGLVKNGFQLNDETMRFLGKRVLEITYGAIEPEKRKSLHENIGDYQEGLAQRHLLSSASVLAYHYQRSRNEEKARRYEEMRQAHGEWIFNRDEAFTYSGELPEIDEAFDQPLDEKGRGTIPKVLRCLLSAVRSLKLYPADSPAIARSRAQALETLRGLLESNSSLLLSQTHHTLRANGERLEVTDYQSLAQAFLELMDLADLEAIRFKQGLPDEELHVLLQALATLKPSEIGRGYWRKIREEEGLHYIELQQQPSSAVRKVRKAKREEAANHPPSSVHFAPEEELQGEELLAVPLILRAFLGAAKNAQLYPMESRPVTRAIKELHEALASVLDKRAILNLGNADGTLIVNGAKVNTRDYSELAQTFLSFVQATQLTNISFSAELSEEDVASFIGALGRAGSLRVDESSWTDLLEGQKLSHIAVNQSQYELTWRKPVLEDEERPSPSDERVDSQEREYSSDLERTIAETPLEQLEGDFPVLVWKLLEAGQTDAFQLLLERLFDGYPKRPIEERERTIRAITRAFEHVNLAKRNHFSQTGLGDLLECLRSERDPKILRELVSLLNQISMESIQLSDYRLAGLVVQGIRERRKALEEQEPALAGVLGGLLSLDVDVNACSIVHEDLCSGSASRSRRAAEFLEALGEHAIPMAIEIIKEERGVRVRQLTARLLAGLGPTAARELKRALALEVTVEQRFRILEIIDLVTRDLKDVVSYSLGDANPKIRRAAFRLAERLKDDAIIEVILPFAHHEDLAVTKGTISSLAQMGSIKAAQAVAQILDQTRNPELAIVCCQALGQLGDPASVQCLERVLTRRSRLWLGLGWPNQVRATAALALAQIRHQWAKDALRKFLGDSDPQVKQIAAAHSNESVVVAEGSAPAEPESETLASTETLAELESQSRVPETSEEEVAAPEPETVPSEVSR